VKVTENKILRLKLISVSVGENVIKKFLCRTVLLHC